MVIEIKIDKEKFDKIKYMKDYQFERYLVDKLRSFERFLEYHDEKALEKKKEELQKRLRDMKEEIADLTKFCEKAQEDQVRMVEWMDKLSLENERFMKEMKKWRQ